MERLVTPPCCGVLLCVATFGCCWLKFENGGFFHAPFVDVETIEVLFPGRVFQNVRVSNNKIIQLLSYTLRGRGIRAKFSSLLGMSGNPKFQRKQHSNVVILKRYENIRNNASVSEIIILPSKSYDIFLAANRDPP